jgi:hypothetical protein
MGFGSWSVRLACVCLVGALALGGCSGEGSQRSGGGNFGGGGNGGGGNYGNGGGSNSGSAANTQWVNGWSCDGLEKTFISGDPASDPLHDWTQADISAANSEYAQRC